jgi:hypothetical protein
MIEETKTMAHLKPFPYLAASALVAALMSTGCRVDDYMQANEPAPQGTISDSIWRAQESNAEASDFVVHEHEFIGNSARMNTAGETHVKQIAARLPTTPFVVLVEPSSMSPRKGDTFGFAVHNDAKLDRQRRDIIVASLEKMGVEDADRRVVTSPALTPGFEQGEAQRSYGQFLNGGGGRGGGRGGIGGGGGGGIGGIGGGF